MDLFPKKKSDETAGMPDLSEDVTSEPLRAGDDIHDSLVVGTMAAETTFSFDGSTLSVSSLTTEVSTP